MIQLSSLVKIRIQCIHKSLMATSFPCVSRSIPDQWSADNTESYIFRLVFFNQVTLFPKDYRSIEWLVSHSTQHEIGIYMSDPLAIQFQEACKGLQVLHATVSIFEGLLMYACPNRFRNSGSKPRGSYCPSDLGLMPFPFPHVCLTRQTHLLWSSSMQRQPSRKSCCSNIL